ncbi:hypothetical protein [Serinibacter arcticus]|uniref:hypothetical protein n=1 Tax=Serinibacter arcticus TaxID=1655435 RepID=UPI00130487DD|nr:hypothetical protein [Serinibacter arcticus]
MRSARYRGRPAGVVMTACLRRPDRPVLVEVSRELGTRVHTGADLRGEAARLAAHAVATSSGSPAPLVLEDCGPARLVAALLAAGSLGVDVALVGASAPPGLATEIRDRWRGVLVTADTALPRTAVDLLRLPPPARSGRVSMLTSGTTGRPHPVVRRGVPATAWPTVLDLGAASGIRRDEVTAIAPPLEHGHGFSVLMAALALGSPVLVGRDDALLGALAEHRARC